MKRNEKQKLSELIKEELSRKVQEAKNELTNLSLQKASGKLKDVHTFAKKRKELALLMTLARERELKEKRKI